MSENQVPAYVNPSVLQPGQTVYSVLDKDHTRLIVLRVEPMLVCRVEGDPDGTEHMLFAHEVEPVA